MRGKESITGDFKKAAGPEIVHVELNPYTNTASRAVENLNGSTKPNANGFEDVAVEHEYNFKDPPSVTLIGADGTGRDWYTTIPLKDADPALQKEAAQLKAQLDKVPRDTIVTARTYDGNAKVRMEKCDEHGTRLRLREYDFGDGTVETSVPVSEDKDSFVKHTQKKQAIGEAPVDVQEEAAKAERLHADLTDNKTAAFAPERATPKAMPLITAARAERDRQSDLELHLLEAQGTPQKNPTSQPK
jgi:hypothetical protein